MSELNQSRLEEALHLLGEFLAHARAEPVRLFHAATDPLRTRRSTDLADLQALSPTSDEAKETLEWMQALGLINAANRTEVAMVLRTLGHDAFIPTT